MTKARLKASTSTPTGTDQDGLLPGAGVIIPDTAEWDAWSAHKRSKGISLALMNEHARQLLEFWVPSRWPPDDYRSAETWPTGDRFHYRKVLASRIAERQSMLAAMPIERRRDLAATLRRAIKPMPRDGSR